MHDETIKWDTYRSVKQVIVVRKDLNMRKGKLAAQAAHASMKSIMRRMSTTRSGDQDIYVMSLYDEDPMRLWLKGQFIKVVVSVDTLKDLMLVREKAREWGVPTVTITDSGKTEFHGNPTVTAMAVGPDFSNRVDLVTGDLPLL